MKKILLLISAVTLFFNSFAQNCISNTSSIAFNSSYVSLNSNNGLDITDSISIEAYIYATSWALTSAQNTIVCKHGWSAGEGGYVFRAGGTGELSFNFACDSAGINVSWRELVSTTAALQLNTWYHVAATFSGSETKLYINGVLNNTYTFPTPVSIIPGPTYSMKFGKLSDDVQPETRYWSGNLDEIRIWHRVLSQSELAANMGHHLDTTGVVGLVGYWRLNESTGTTVADMGSGNNTGDLINASWSTNVPFGAGPAMPIITQAPPYLFSSATSGNQWYVDGNLIPGATGTGYQPLVNGSYTVMVTDTNNCSATSAAVIVTTLGVDQISSQKVLLHSGDINGKLQFALPESVLVNSELKIFDTTGRIILNLSQGHVNGEVDVQSLSPGIYNLVLKTASRQYAEKIMIR